MGVVLAAIDNSDAAGRVLAAAAALARSLGDELEAVHVREDGNELAGAAAERADVTLHELEDPTAESLLADAARSEVRALVVGARGRPAALRRLGHVAVELMVSVGKALVVVPPLAEPLELRRALVPVDGTRATSQALEKAAELVRGSEAELVVLNVRDPETVPAFSDQPQHETAVWSKEFLERYCGSLGRDLHLELRIGVPGQHIVDAARELDVHLIVLGWSQDLSPGRAAVVREVLARADVPVVLLPTDSGAGRR